MNIFSNFCFHFGGPGEASIESRGRGNDQFLGQDMGIFDELWEIS